MERYSKVASFCVEREINRVLDIGVHMDIKLKSSFKLNSNMSELQIILAVSILCLTWNCYLHEGGQTLIEQCEALKRDFKHCILNANPQILGRYFEKFEKIDEDLYYFSNK